MGTTAWGRIALLATVGALTGVLPCGAMHVHTASRPRASLDRPGDERVRPAEAASIALETFVRLDADASGAISRHEWRRRNAAADPGRDFEALDTNGDEQISREEWSYAFGKRAVVLRLLPSLEQPRDDDATMEHSAALLSLTF